MFQIQIAYHATINTLTYQEQEVAMAAYEKIAAAVREYRMFKNERGESVEVETDDGKASFRLERIDAVTIAKVTAEGPLDRIFLEREKMLRGMRREMGLPETARGRLVSPDIVLDDVSAAKVSEQ